MTMQHEQHTPDDDDIDLATADRGDEVGAEAEGEEAEESEEAEGQPRDKNGKFAPKVKSEESEEEEEEEESEEEESEGGEKAENLPIRLNKMRDQRDRERAAREAAERRAAELEAQLKGGGKKDDAPEDPAARINTELDELYEKVEEARADGETKTAAQLQRKIDSLNRQLIDLDTSHKTARAANAATEQARFGAMLDRLEELLPEVDPTSDDYDADAVKDIEFHIVAYERAGMSPTQALAKAAKVLHGVDLGAKAKKPAEEKKAPDKKKPDVKKAVEHSKKQPPDSSKLGVNKDDTKIDVEALSDDEFDKLPESVKAKYRGDFVE